MGNVWFCSTNVGGKHLALVSLELGKVRPAHLGDPEAGNTQVRTYTDK